MKRPEQAQKGSSYLCMGSVYYSEAEANENWGH
jgi:hypothetical protein